MTNGRYARAAKFVNVIVYMLIVGSAEANTNPAGDPAVRLIAGWAGHDVAVELSRAFFAASQDGVSAMDVVDSSNAASALAAGQYHAGFVQQGLVSDTYRDACGHLETHAIGVTVVAVVVNSRCPVQTITLADLGGIFRERTREWKGVGRARQSASIDLFGLATTGVEAHIMRIRCMNGFPFAGNFTDLHRTSPGQKANSTQVVAAVGERPNSIGFVRWTPNRCRSARAWATAV